MLVALYDENGHLDHQSDITANHGKNHPIMKTEPEDFLSDEITADRTRKQHENVTRREFDRGLVVAKALGFSLYLISSGFPGVPCTYLRRRSSQK